MQIDVFYAPYCSACGRIRPRLRRLASAQGEKLVLRELDVVEHLDEAVSAGVVRTPSVVVGLVHQPLRQNSVRERCTFQ